MWIIGFDSVLLSTYGPRTVVGEKVEPQSTGKKRERLGCGSRISRLLESRLSAGIAPYVVGIEMSI